MCPFSCIFFTANGPFYLWWVIKLRGAKKEEEEQNRRALISLTPGWNSIYCCSFSLLDRGQSGFSSWHKRKSRSCWELIYKESFSKRPCQNTGRILMAILFTLSHVLTSSGWPFNHLCFSTASCRPSHSSVSFTSGSYNKNLRPQYFKCFWLEILKVMV